MGILDTIEGVLAERHPDWALVRTGAHPIDRGDNMNETIETDKSIGPAPDGETREYKKACTCGSHKRTKVEFLTDEGMATLVKCADCGATISMDLKEVGQ